MRYFTHESPQYSDLSICHYGIASINPGDSNGPAIWDCYLMHYILKGKGLCQIDGQTYHLEEGQGFLISPCQIGFYRSDLADPWKYCWVAFTGLNAGYFLKQAGLSDKSPIFSYGEKDDIESCIAQMMAADSRIPGRETLHLSLLYSFLTILIENASRDSCSIKDEDRKSIYVKHAIHYMKTNYWRKITIADVSRYIGLNISYMGAVFKEQMGMSPQQFLVRYRMEKACELMSNKLLAISDIARSVGYADPFLFSRIFKKETGLSPRQYRINRESGA